MPKIHGLIKIGLVLGGYLVACLVASTLFYINQLFTQDPSQVSVGMSAFGDSILFITTFGFMALFPTGFAIYFLVKKIYL